MRFHTSFPRVVHNTAGKREQTNNDKCRTQRQKKEEER